MKEQLKIDLNNLSKNKLFKIAEEKDIDLKKSMRKEEIIDRLFEDIDHDELEEISKDYIYAGRTSVSFWKYTPEENTEKTIEKGNLPKILKLMCDGENPFEIERRPAITETPQIISAKFINDDLCRIKFVSRGKPRTIPIEYELETIYTTIFADSILDLKNRIFEVRTEYKNANKTAEHFFNILNKHKGYEHGFRQIVIDLNTVISLKSELNGGMRDHTGKVQSGKSIYDSVKVKGSPIIEDLWNEDEFQKDIEGMYTTSSGIRFISPVTADRVTIEVSTKSSSIFFKSHASEQDIKFVCDKLIGISNR